MYKTLATELWSFAGHYGACRIADIACGTGVSTRVLSRGADRRAVIRGYDASAAMLHFAKLQLDPRVEYFHISGLKKEIFDMIFCSAAIWQLGIELLRALYLENLEPHGNLVFNVPTRFMNCRELRSSQ